MTVTVSNLCTFYKRICEYTCISIQCIAINMERTTLQYKLHGTCTHDNVMLHTESLRQSFSHRWSHLLSSIGKLKSKYAKIFLLMRFE